MSHADLTATVRDRVQETLADLNLHGDEQLRETILIRGGNYCGRRFEADGGHALWFVEEDQLKFFRADGSVARVVEHISAFQRDIRAAA
jgi:hypothetical protein